MCLKRQNSKLRPAHRNTTRAELVLLQVPTAGPTASHGQTATSSGSSTDPFQVNLGLDFRTV